MSDLDSAIDAATEALSNESGHWPFQLTRHAARIAVEAAAPYLLPDVHWALVLDEERQRAARAEAERDNLAAQLGLALAAWKEGRHVPE